MKVDLNTGVFTSTTIHFHYSQMDNTAEQLLKGMEELSTMFSSRMGEFDRNLQQPGSTAPGSTVKSLSAEFSSFKTFVWKSLGILKSQVDLFVLGLDRMAWIICGERCSSSMALKRTRMKTPPRRFLLC